MEIYLLPCRSNILLDETYTAKITDLGFGLPTLKQIGSTSTLSFAGSYDLVRSRGYVAPEFKDGIIGPATDVYSYGIVISCRLQILGDVNCIFLYYYRLHLRYSLDYLFTLHLEQKKNWFVIIWHNIIITIYPLHNIIINIILVL